MRKIKWGVMGTAGIAKGCTIPGMQQVETCELYAIAGRKQEKVEEFRKLFGFEKAYTSYEELLADPEVEAVYIPLSNEIHYEWVMKAIEAGKHILCEKPLTPTRKQAEELFAAADAKGVVLMEAFAYLHSPIVSAIKAELDAGTIGDVLYLENAFVYSEHDISNIRMRRETFGGATYDVGCYCTSQILWLLGEDPDKVMAVAEYSDHDIDICTTGVMTFASGKRAVFTCGMVLEKGMDRRIDRIQIHGTKGKITSCAEYNQAGELSYTVTTSSGSQTKTVTAPQNYGLEVAQLGRCITDGETPHVSHAFTLRNLAVLDRVLDAIGYRTK